MLRLDRAIGTLIDSLYKLRDSSTIVFSLTAITRSRCRRSWRRPNRAQLPPMRVDSAIVAKTFRVGHRGARRRLERVRLRGRDAVRRQGIAREERHQARFAGARFADAAEARAGRLSRGRFQTILKADHDRSSVRGGTRCRRIIRCSSS
jgi:hypothetical protein